jgi:hypothetical protein
VSGAAPREYQQRRPENSVLYRIARRHTDLSRLIDGTELTFPVLDSYNTFDAAAMDVNVQ